jgi:hypothetical protein
VNPLLGIYSKGMESVWRRHLHSHAHCNAVHNSQEMERLTPVSVDEWIRKCGAYTQWNVIQP